MYEQSLYNNDNKLERVKTKKSERVKTQEDKITHLYLNLYREMYVLSNISANFKVITMVKY